MHIIVNSFAESLKSLADAVTEDQFKVFVEQYFKNFENIFLKPRAVSKEFRLSIVDRNHVSLPEKHRVLKTLTFDDFKTFCNDYLRAMRIKAIMQGNLNETTAERIMLDVVKTLDYGQINNVSMI